MSSQSLTNSEIKSFVQKQTSVATPKITFSIDDILHEKNNNVNDKDFDKNNMNLGEAKLAARKLLTNNKESETNSR